MYIFDINGLFCVDWAVFHYDGSNYSALKPIEL